MQLRSNLTGMGFVLALHVELFRHDRENLHSLRTRCRQTATAA